MLIGTNVYCLVMCYANYKEYPEEHGKLILQSFTAMKEI